MAATERCAASMPERRAVRGRGTDRLTVVLLSVAAFLAVLALLAAQVRASAPEAGAHRLVIVRRVYRTRVIETLVGGATAGPGAMVTESVSSSGSAAPVAVAPTTRVS